MQKLLTTKEAALTLHVPPGTLERWRQVGEGPPFGKIGRRVFYKVDELEKWVDERFAAHGPSAA